MTLTLLLRFRVHHVRTITDLDFTASRYFLVAPDDDFVVGEVEVAVGLAAVIELTRMQISGSPGGVVVADDAVKPVLIVRQRFRGVDGVFAQHDELGHFEGIEFDPLNVV